MENELNAGQSPWMRRLPWLMGGAAFLLYCLTLNPWVSSASMGQVAKVAGYSWQSETLDPLYYAVSSPLRLLPPRLIPLGVNLLSALGAALTLALLARAVSLLPHDRTQDQRERETSVGSLLSGNLAWLPPVLAAVVCGLQLTFWEHGTNGTPEMVHLVCFAYAVRALLEFRFDGREAWLYKGAFAFAALMTSDWLFVAFGPLFLGAVIWLCGLSFFSLRFLGRLMLCGLAGLSLYLLLPLLASLSKIEPLGFWEALRMNVAAQKYVLTLLPQIFPKNVFLLLSLTSLLPVFVMSIRWASHFGDSSQVGQWVTKYVFHIVHLLMLLTCTWVMLDPRFSPRNIGYGLPFLSLYWLAALSVGYFSGYFLVIFRPFNNRGRQQDPFERPLNRLASGFVILLALVAPAILCLKNHPEIRINNRNEVRDIAELVAAKLPKSGYLLSDDPRWALLTKIWLARTDRDKDFVIAETWALRSPGYHRYQRQKYGERWPFAEEARRKDLLSVAFMLETLKRLEKVGELYYLHPSFGFFFEHYYAEPHGLVFKLKPYGDTTLLPPALSPPILAENEAFWDKVSREQLPKILQILTPKYPTATKSLRDELTKILKLSAESHAELRSLGTLYSRTLNYWAVELQKAGDLEKSAVQFDLAQQINPKNIVAKINLAFNRNYRAGKRERVISPTTVEDLFGDEYRSWDAVLTANGPFDEQNLCYAQGLTLFQNGLYRQSAQAFDRVHTFAPEDPPSRLWLGQLNLMARKPARALELVREIVEQPARFELDTTNRTDALCLVAKAHLQLNQSDQAKTLLEVAIQASPTNFYLLANAIGILSGSGDYSTALINVDRLLTLNPDSDFGLLHKGYINIQLNAYAEAVLAMTQLLTIKTNQPEALLNRAIAYFRSEKFDPARQDYETLQRVWPTLYQNQISYGLGEIAFRRNDTNGAIRQYQTYLSNAVPNSAETKLIESRLRELKGDKPTKP